MSTETNKSFNWSKLTALSWLMPKSDVETSNDDSNPSIISFESNSSNQKSLASLSIYDLIRRSQFTLLPLHEQNESLDRSTSSVTESNDNSEQTIHFNQPIEPEESSSSSNLLDDTEFLVDVRYASFWFGLSMIFAILIGILRGWTQCVEFVSGYLLEQSLSVDNLFVFLVLFDYFKVPLPYQSRVLFYGLAMAVFLRGLFIGLGFAMIHNFRYIMLLLAALLLFSAYKILVSGDDDDEDDDLANNAVVRISKQLFRTTDHYDGNRFFTRENGILFATPLFLCLVCVEVSDVIFAADSVPAVFGVTNDIFVIFTSNIFAIASLRSVYGVLSKAVQELDYLEKAVGLILAIISIKMIFETFNLHILSPFQSLVLVISILTGGIVASLYKSSKSSDNSKESEESSSVSVA